MPRQRLNISQVLSEIERSAGPQARQTADRLFWLATDLGAEPWSRGRSVALRFPGPAGGPPGLSFLVLSTAGTVYNNWHDRWAQVGMSEAQINEYERGMIAAVGHDFVGHPSRYQKAAPLLKVAANWDAVEAVLSQAASRLKRALGRGSADEGGGDESSGLLEALEGLLTETRATRRGRNATLRRAALALADGRCAACERDFGSYLEGRGRGALQVHHRRQLSAREMPSLTRVEDLAVLCANCHAIIHADADEALKVEDLRALIRAEQPQTS